MTSLAPPVCSWVQVGGRCGAGTLNGGPHRSLPTCPLQGHCYMKKLALDLELLHIIVQDHQEQQDTGHTLKPSLSQSSLCHHEVGLRASPG